MKQREARDAHARLMASITRVAVLLAIILAGVLIYPRLPPSVHKQVKSIVKMIPFIGDGK